MWIPDTFKKYRVVREKERDDDPPGGSGLDKSFYHTQLSTMLADYETYEKLNRDPTQRYKEELKGV